jgi:hypothetical protein
MGITKQLGIVLGRNWYWTGYEVEKGHLVRGQERDRIRYTFLRETARDRQVRELHGNGWIRAMVGLFLAGSGWAGERECSVVSDVDVC